MQSNAVDAFILFNIRETLVGKIVAELGSYNISTYFAPRDRETEGSSQQVQDMQMEQATAVLVFLGNAGWGPTQLPVARHALKLGKKIVIVEIGRPPKDAYDVIGEGFQQLTRLDFTNPTPESYKQLIEKIHRSDSTPNTPIPEPPLPPDGRVEMIINDVIEGSETDRADLVRHSGGVSPKDRPAFATGLRSEITNRFTPDEKGVYVNPPRNEREMPSIRSWLFSLLIALDHESQESRDLLSRHATEEFEREHSVRFWILAGLYWNDAPYLGDIAGIAQKDQNLEVRYLATAITDPGSERMIARFRSALGGSFDDAFPVLRVLRVVAIPPLIEDVCKLLIQAKTGSNFAFDALYALSNRNVAGEAAKRLQEYPGVPPIVELVMVATRGADQNAARNFAVLLLAFDDLVVDTLLRNEVNPANRKAARWLRESIQRLGQKKGKNSVYAAVVNPDTIDVDDDRLDIREDVQTLVAVMLAKDVTPPMAIGLFGDWGTGKSFFMKSMKAAIDDITEPTTPANPKSRFYGRVVQIEFNAWHYIDSNLWASLVSHILTNLESYVIPKPTRDQKQATLYSQMDSAKADVQKATTQKDRAQGVIKEQETKLVQIQTERWKKEADLSNLHLSELATVLLENKEVKQKLDESLKEIGVPTLLQSTSDLSSVIAEAYTVRGRVTSLFLALPSYKNWWIWLLLIFAVLLLPGGMYLANKFLPLDNFIVTVSAVVAQITTVTIAAAGLLRKAVSTAKTGIDKLEETKQRVDELIEKKRQTQTGDEKKLQGEIAQLKVQEQEAEARVAAAAAKIIELEDQIRSINEERSLVRFLTERIHSQDYRKHLGIISTIRQDFDSLTDRLKLANETPDPNFHSADRIVLYIDDLDRCPADKVMEVLQAVHLLLAYPLFVVVVGVDPRWLIHSLTATYSAFQAKGADAGIDADLWQTTPQNYLEKIFQIPFNLNPMTSTGFENLIGGLLSNAKGESRSDGDSAGASSDTDSQKTVQEGSGSAKTPSPDTAGGGQTDRNPAGGGQADQTTTPGAAKGDTPIVEEAPFTVREEALEIRTWEIELAERLFSLIPTPRSAKRFTNIYRILKARVSIEDLADFEGVENAPGLFQIPMLLLAMLLGDPASSMKAFPVILSQARLGSGISKAFEVLLEGPDVPQNLRALREKIMPIISDPSFSDAPEAFVEWVPRVARFSFDVGRSVQSPPATKALQ